MEPWHWLWEDGGLILLEDNPAAHWILEDSPTNEHTVSPPGLEQQPGGFIPRPTIYLKKVRKGAKPEEEIEALPPVVLPPVNVEALMKGLLEGEQARIEDEDDAALLLAMLA